MQYRFSTLAKGAFFAAAALASTAASAAVQFTIPMSGSSSLTSDGGSRTYSLSDGLGNTLNARVTAWSMATGTNNALTSTSAISNARVGRYSTGLGVMNDPENAGTYTTNEHTIDNYLGRDFLIIQFDKPVEFVSGEFTPYKLGSNSYYDLDYSLAVGFANYASIPSLNGKKYSDLKALFGNDIRTYADAATNGNTQTNSLNQIGRAGTIWLVGGAFSDPDTTKKFDAFKFNNLTVRVPVPEPSTWLMMIVGFGFIGGAIRRQKQAQTPAIA